MYPLYVEERINHTTMLDKKFKYYLDHQEELIPLYDGNVIIGNQVVVHTTIARMHTIPLWRNMSLGHS